VPGRPVRGPVVRAGFARLARAGGGRAAGPYSGWNQYLGGADSPQDSARKQIHKNNARQLQAAWTYPTGDSKQYRFNPAVVDGVYRGQHGKRYAAVTATGTRVVFALP